MTNAVLGGLLSRSGGTRSTREMESVLTALDRSQAVIEFKPDGTIITANENFLLVMGYRLDEIQGRHHRIFVEPDYAQSAEYKNFWTSLSAGEFHSAEYKRISKDGREVWIQASYNPVFTRGGKVEKIVKYAADITEQTLRNATYKGQIEAINKAQAVIFFQTDGTIVDANDNFLAAMGYRLEEIQGQHHRMFVEASYAQSAEYRDFWEILRRGQYHAGEYKRLGKGGREIWIQATYNPILDPNGEVFTIVKYASDVTQQVTEREEAARINGEIQSRLDSILASISNASEKTSSASAASHETAQMVQTVAAAAEQYQSSTNEIAQSVESSKNAVDRVMEQTAGADSMTQQLNSAAEAMNNIVEVIQEIAGQINLLALNATIESARAGEAGKGFAVVASEVKNLANQVAKATEDISNEITAMQGISGEVVEKLGSISSALESVETSVEGVGGAVKEQAATTQELSTNMQSAASAVNDIHGSLDVIAGAVRDAHSSTEEVTELRRQLGTGE